MADLKYNGLDFLAASLQELAKLTAEEGYSVLQPAAQLLADKFRAKTEKTFVQRSGDLAKSFRIKQVSGSGEFPAAMVTPQGKHSGSTTGKRNKRTGKSDRRGKRGNYSGTNAEVAYILERGSPRIHATYFIEYTGEQAEPEVIAEMQKAWTELCKKKGL